MSPHRRCGGVRAAVASTRGGSRRDRRFDLLALEARLLAEERVHDAVALDARAARERAPPLRDAAHQVLGGHALVLKDALQRERVARQPAVEPAMQSVAGSQFSSVQLSSVQFSSRLFSKPKHLLYCTVRYNAHTVRRCAI